MAAAFPVFSFGASAGAGGAPGTLHPEETLGLEAFPRVPPAVSEVGEDWNDPRPTIESCRLAARVSTALVEAFMMHLGADPDVDLEQLAHVPEATVTELIPRVQVEGQPVSPLQQGQLAFFWKTLKKAVLPESPPASAGPAVWAPPPPEPETQKRKIAEVLDQVDDTQFPVLSLAKITELRIVYRMVTGGDPPDHARPTAEHLSALAHRLSTGAAPYVDFAVFGPYGKRQAKLMKFTAQVFIGNELVTRQLRGPANHTEWKAGWAVFRSATIMLQAASPAALDSYSRGVEELVLLFPSSWGVVSMADETLRAERWELLKETMPTANWSEIISESAFGATTMAHWWYLHVVGPLSNGTRTKAVVAAVEGHAPPSSGDGQPGSSSGPGGQQPSRATNRPSTVGEGKPGACHKFNYSKCLNPNCPNPHACVGCGARWPFRTCKKCNPDAATPDGKEGKGQSREAGSEKGKGKASPADTQPDSTEGKKKKKSKHRGGAAMKGGGSGK